MGRHRVQAPLHHIDMCSSGSSSSSVRGVLDGIKYGDRCGRQGIQHRGIQIAAVHWEDDKSCHRHSVHPPRLLHYRHKQEATGESIILLWGHQTRSWHPARPDNAQRHLGLFPPQRASLPPRGRKLALKRKEAFQI